METRQITQIKLWYLVLNPMTSNTECGELVAHSYERDKLIDWYNNQFAEESYYTIGEHYFPAKGDFSANFSEGYKYYKVFKQGSILEWYNPIHSLEDIDSYGHGIRWEWVNDDCNIPGYKVE